MQPIGAARCDISVVERGGVGTLAARNLDGVLPRHVFCIASTTTPVTCSTLADGPVLDGKFPRLRGHANECRTVPFMLAASNSF